MLSTQITYSHKVSVNTVCMRRSMRREGRERRTSSPNTDPSMGDGSSSTADDHGLSPLIRTCFAVHAYHLESDPVRAHWDAALVSTTLGGLLASARGVFVALTMPKGLRMSTFASVTQACLPLYIVPFVLGSQFDCLTATTTTSRFPNHSSGADVLG